ncbi:ADP-heptose--LPS heptosyltransferase RfaF [Flavobacteriaceae bacterium R38]|nr:ADP-heptose--LPS heptosyltransferase RfaF [Flavobacteriaceae bacterium R38]
MGDVAMTVPVLRAFTAQYPNIKITVLSRAFFKPIFDNIPNVTFYEADVKGKHKGILGLYKLSKELKALQIDAVADLHNVLRSKILKFYFNLRGLKVIQINKGRSDKKTLTALENKVFKPLKTTHERYTEVFKKLGFPINLEEHKFPLKAELNVKIHNLIGTAPKKWICIAPFAAHKSKTYSLDLLSEVIDKLIVKNKYRIILIGGGEKQAALLESLSSKEENVINVTGKLSFKEELQLISNLDLMISMDSGNAHLAAMYGVKTITLWGVTHPYAGFYPFGQDKDNALLADREKYPLIPTSVYGNKFPEGYEKAIDTITPQMVLEKIKEVL